MKVFLNIKIDFLCIKSDGFHPLNSCHKTKLLKWKKSENEENKNGKVKALS
jgi:hypothetical protein